MKFLARVNHWVWIASAAACVALGSWTGALWGQANGVESGGTAGTLSSAATRAATSQPASLLDALNFDQLAKNKIRAWLILLFAILVAVAAGRVVSFVLQRIAGRLEKRGWHAYAEVFSGLCSPANLALFAMGMTVGLIDLQMGDLLRDFSKRILILLYTISGFWYAFNLVAALELALRKITQRTETTLDDDLVPVIRKALRIFIVVIGSLFILQNVFNRDIGAWLAGFGIAGLAVSLAAQDSLKNLFGSLTILFDRPFTVGQRIKFHAFDGVVEEIGFRSTKVRTGDGSVVTIPNSLIVNESVDNWARRQKIRRILNVTIAYETPAAKVREAVKIIRDMLASEEFRRSVYDADTVANVDPPRVFFDEFNAESLNIKVYYWYRTGDWWGYLEFTERFNLKLMEEFERAGIVFAYPTRRMIVEGRWGMENVTAKSAQESLPGAN
jgi:MscS family membrane protein